MVGGLRYVCLNIDGWWVERCMFGYKWMVGWVEICIFGYR